ncbi:hypothetical protein GO495_17625 [Chitinophaga oryziterrae]|uniref:Uncharacterized protein n=1 Tax=Chitinophaga oryziterrae TaxID=1031224 RepID=A0A6N8JAZ1_9BACT|nr:hypothetical protein [Chitinophaga oryziterrae]MVT42417.1 hypothetical protein [Chitinophaga oryziterrae]
MSLKQFFDENLKSSETVQQEDAFEKYLKTHGTERAQGYLDALEDVTEKLNKWHLQGHNEHDAYKIIFRNFSLIDAAKKLISKAFPNKKSDLKP